jgi:hypothetical protein
MYQNSRETKHFLFWKDFYLKRVGGWDSADGIVTCYGLDGIGFDPSAGKVF